MATRTNDLTEFAKPIADELVATSGSLKRILSAGVLALNDLTPHEKEIYMARAIGREPKPFSSDEDLDEEIRAFARSFAVLTQKLERRAAANAQKKPRRKSATG